MKAVAAAMRDPAGLLSDRSPGARAPGALYATKAPRATQAVAGPLAPVLAAEPDPVAVAEEPMISSTLPDETLPSAFVAVPDQPGPLAAGGPIFGPGPLIAGPSPFIGFGPPQIPDDGTPPTPPPPPPIAGVPEPSTWLMLLLGFFGVGTLLRRRPASDAAKTA